MSEKTRFQRMIEGWVSGEVDLAPIGHLVGFRFTSCEGGVIRVELDAGSRHHNPMGIVHGGIFCDIADAAMGVAFAYTLADGESFATLQLQASYLRAVREGHLIATGRVVHRGRTIGHLECDVVDGEGKAVAKFTSVCSVIRGGG